MIITSVNSKDSRPYIYVSPWQISISLMSNNVPEVLKIIDHQTDHKCEILFETSAVQFSPQYLYLKCNHAHHVTAQNGGDWHLLQ